MACDAGIIAARPLYGKGHTLRIRRPGRDRHHGGCRPCYGTALARRQCSKNSSSIHVGNHSRHIRFYSQNNVAKVYRNVGRCPQNSARKKG